jgi:hypothetical protein
MEVIPVSVLHVDLYTSPESAGSVGDIACYNAVTNATNPPGNTVLPDTLRATDNEFAIVICKLTPDIAHVGFSNGV